jgi:hypothetical protein
MDMRFHRQKAPVPTRFSESFFALDQRFVPAQNCDAGSIIAETLSLSRYKFKVGSWLLENLRDSLWFFYVLHIDDHATVDRCQSSERGRFRLGSSLSDSVSVSIK